MVFGDGKSYEAIVRTYVAGRTVGLEIPGLNRALLLIELEPGKEDSHCGFWLSTVNVAGIEEIETEFKNSLKTLK